MTGLAEFPISARAAAGDLGRARHWYEDRLGLLPEREDPGGVWYRFDGETWLYLYATPSAGTAKNTIAGWGLVCNDNGPPAVLGGQLHVQMSGEPGRT